MRGEDGRRWEHHPKNYICASRRPQSPGMESNFCHDGAAQSLTRVAFLPWSSPVAHSPPTPTGCVREMVQSRFAIFAFMRTRNAHTHTHPHTHTHTHTHTVGRSVRFHPKTERPAILAYTGVESYSCCISLMKRNL